MNNKKRSIVIFKAILCLFAPVICVLVIPELFFLIDKLFSIKSPYYLIVTLLSAPVSLFITGIYFIVGAIREYRHLHCIAQIQMRKGIYMGDPCKHLWTAEEKRTIISFGILYAVGSIAVPVLLYLELNGII